MGKVFHGLKQAAGEFFEDDCMSSGAAIAYYAIFSLPPLMMVLAAIAGYFGVSQERINAMVEQQLGIEATALPGSEEQQAGEAADAEQQPAPGAEAANENGPETAGDQWQGLGMLSRIVGIFILVFTATGLFAQLQFALNRAWGVQPDPEQGGILRFVLKRVLSLGMVLVVAFLLLVSLVLTTMIEQLVALVQFGAPDSAMVVVAAVLNAVAVFIVATLLFAAIFRVLPDANIAWHDVFFGAAMTGLLFVIGKTAIGWYLQHSDMAAGWGAAAAGLVGILVWMYYSSLIVLFGAELTQVWAREYGHGFQPAEGAVQVETTTREKR